MAQILSMGSHTNPKNLKHNRIKEMAQIIRNFDSFTKASIVTILLIIFAVPYIAHNFLQTHQHAAAGFVQRVGTKLSLDGQPYTFTGVNLYNANSRNNCWYPLGYPDGKLDTAMSQIPGANAVRAWFYQDEAGTPTARDWAAFDQTLSIAAKYNKKVIVQLSGEGGDCGDYPKDFQKDLNWYAGGYKNPEASGESYLSWIKEVAAKYKDNTSILMWELVGESAVGTGTCDEAQAVTTLKAFADDTGGAIKSVDPNHLITLGVIGTGQCGASGTDYQTLHSSSGIDVCSVEDYGSPTTTIPGDQWNGMQARINQCATLNKPIFVQESGIKLSTEAQNSQTVRANDFSTKFVAQFAAGISGELIWDYCVDHDGTYGGCDTANYEIMPNDPSLAVLSNFGGTSSTPIPSPTASPTQTPTATPHPTLAPTPAPTDNIRPTISIISPANNTLVKRNSTVQVQASASDNVGVTRVDILVNGTKICSDYSAPYLCPWSVPGKPNAPYTISGFAYDAAGNTGTAFVNVTTGK